MEDHTADLEVGSFVAVNLLDWDQSPGSHWEGPGYTEMMAMSQYTTRKALMSLAGTPTTLAGIEELKIAWTQDLPNEVIYFPTLRYNEISSSGQRPQLISETSTAGLKLKKALLNNLDSF